ncbi:hypothetical protein D9M68_820980 [compost metagenome]
MGPSDKIRGQELLTADVFVLFLMRECIFLAFQRIIVKYAETNYCSIILGKQGLIKCGGSITNTVDIVKYHIVIQHKEQGIFCLLDQVISSAGYPKVLGMFNIADIHFRMLRDISFQAIVGNGGGII